ncbi:hypothetical protein SISSUDRAFT_975312, partial [Sistotremastrum suecicum HHB10207 ss-3]
RTTINYSTMIDFKYLEIDEKRHFDIMNVEGYDLILGTPFFYQHMVLMGINPPQLSIGSIQSVPITEGVGIVKISSKAADILDEALESLRNELREYAKDICKDAVDTDLPPLRKINHTIPIKDPNKVYNWRASKCPESMQKLWQEKRDGYLKSGRWEFKSVPNAVPMLIL